MIRLQTAVATFVAAVATVVAKTEEVGCEDTFPGWSSTYTVSGVISIPNAELNEPFKAWYDAIVGSSRIDYYGGTAKTFKFTNWPTEYGSTVSIVPETTEEYLNKISCFKLDGKKKGDVSLQGVLPNMDGFKCAGTGSINGVTAHKWTSTVTDGQKTNKYIMWVQYLEFLGGLKVPIPVYYEMKGYDTLMRSHFDHYYLSYDNNYQVHPPTEDTWELPMSMTCGGFPGPGEQRGAALMNPMREFIHGDESHHDEAWEDFLKTHNKTHGNADKQFRKFLFKQNHRFILSRNRAGLGYKLGVNGFADRTKAEILIRNGRAYSKNDTNGGLPFPFSSKQVSEKYKTLPEQLDWRIAGAVTPVKDQSICGSCWSFGTTGVMEGAYFMKNNLLIRLSEQALVDCSWGFGNNGCDGGEDFRAYGWIKKHGGLPLEDDYKYLGIDGKCHVDGLKLYAPITGFVNVTPRSEAALKVALFKYGPISVGVDASPKSFPFYSRGVYYNPDCKQSAADLDHSVLAVGYGVLDGKKYWLIKNSWSPLWGDDGYILISIQDNDCGITSAPTYPILKD